MIPSNTPQRRKLLARLLVLGLLLIATGWGGRHLWAWYHFHAAEAALHETGTPEQALLHLDRCLRVWPTRASVHLLTAQAARRAGDLDRATESLDRAIVLAGTTDEGTRERALLTVQRDGLTAERESFLLSYVGEDSRVAIPVLEVLTAEMVRLHRLLDARRHLDDWLGRQPQAVEALVRRAWVADRLLVNDAALADYEAALTLAPDRDPVRLRIAEILLQTKQAAAALPHLEHLAATGGADPAVQLAFARCRFDLGDLGEAGQLLEPLLASESPSAATLGLRGRLALADGDFRQAESWLRRAVARDPHDREATYSLLVCLKSLDRPSEAEGLAKHLARMDADLKRMGVLMEQVVRRPRDVALRTEIGQVFLRNGMKEDGLRWLGSALELDPECAAAHRTLAEHFEKAGDPERAAKHRR